MTSPVTDWDVCRAGTRCRTRTTDGPGFADGRGLCGPCEAHGRHAIEQLPYLYGRVRARVGKDASVQGVGSDGGSGSSAKVDPPTPLNLSMDFLARRVVWELDVWAQPVWERTIGAGRPDWSTPNTWPVPRSAGLLVTHYQVLRNLPPVAFWPYGTDPGALDELDGPGAIVSLVDLYHRVRSVVGEDRRLVPRGAPCPQPPVGCGQVRTLVQETGDDTVWCTCCGWSCDSVQYEMYAITWRAPALGPCPDTTCRALVGEPHGICGIRRCMVTGRRWADCDNLHDGGLPVVPCGDDIWTGIHPGVSEARAYGITLAALLERGTWDRDAGRWYLDVADELAVADA